MQQPDRISRHSSDVDQYCSDIDRVSRTVLLAESELRNGKLDIVGIREMVNEIVGDTLAPSCATPLDDLQEYCQGAAYFFQQHGQESPKIQAGRLFGFRPDKFSGEVSTSLDGAVILVEFTDIQDFMHAKYAMRKGVFSQEDRTAWFYRVVHFEGHRIPISVSSGLGVSQWGPLDIPVVGQGDTAIHEMTHFRNDILGMNFYSRWGGRDTYEMLTYDDLQDEILAFFSEWLQRAKVQLAILHDVRYHFYRRMENAGHQERERFFRDVQKYISTASAVRKLRPDTYHVDLAIIPLHRWKRYLGYLEKGRAG